SYLDYAMSVIVARALPDARDGLKPVHRRILHAMYTMGVRPDSDFRKSARIVGEVLGKYHPHGDMAVYEAMARMAQDFSMRYALIAGQGNFGSIDGDSPAAMRYTEARLAPLAMLALTDIDQDTVDFVPNFDGSLPEPTVLPAGFPNLLINGATGIAVGMATNIPPHNLGEVCDALVFLLENWTRLDKISVDDLMDFIRGPDFPTGGLLLRSRDKAEGLGAAYGTGRGRVTVQARTHIEEMGRGRSRIIVTELPFQTNKAALIERIAELSRGGQLDGLSDLRDESDRQGMRIVIELARTADPARVLASLYQRTPMQSTFGISMLALVEDEPRLLSLKQALRVYLDHRLEVTRRRSQYELERARERAHILAGLRTALNHLDEVIKLIRAAHDVDQARLRLMKRFRLSDLQARAILDMPLRRLAALERKKIEQEHKETLARITELEGLLASEKRMRGYIADELRQLKTDFGDRRRTQIVDAGKTKRAGPLTAGDVLEEKDTWVAVTPDGLISRSPTARLPRLSGRDAPSLLVSGRTSDAVYLFAADGHCGAVPIHRLPEVDDPARGSAAGGATPLPPGVRPVAALVVPSEVAKSGAATLLLGTRQGVVKRIPLEALPGPSGRAFSVIALGSGDQLGWARLTGGSDEILLASTSGQVIRFPEGEVRTVGLAAAGVMGMRLEKKEQLVAVEVTRREGDLLIITETGFGKRVPLAQFPVQGRNGKGLRVYKAGVNLAGAAIGGDDDHAVAHLARGAARSVKFAAAPRRSRAANGARLVDPGTKDKVVLLGAAVVRPAAAEVAPAGTKAKGKKKPPLAKTGKATGRASKASKERKKPGGRKPQKGTRRPKGVKKSGKKR
ncbi:MAG TPA: DNA topoisomerase (ATP-hydrolyzing), partial [Anaerolineales bacterium]|nr:DNA topoisomerase (ATP-hydrolyzing) [Anaerolineales bacterium]